MKKRKITDIDMHISRMVRARRLARGLSQTELGNALGVTFQQVQKYEKASNRISVGTLYRIAKVLDVPVIFFFNGLAESGTKANGNSMNAALEFLSTKDGLRIVSAMIKMPDRLRHELSNHIATVAEATS